MNDALNSEQTAIAEPIIAGLDVPQLQAVRARIDERIKELRDTGQAELIKKFADDCARLGFTVRDCIATSKRKPRRGRPKHEREEG